MPTRDSFTSPSNRRRREGRSRRSNQNDADAEFKRQIKAERRAQVMDNVMDQDVTEHNEGSAAIGDTLEAGNVTSVRRPHSSGGSRSRSSRSPHRGNGRRHERPPKGSSKGAPVQVGAVAASGRAFGAPRRPPTARDNTTRSIAGDGYNNFASNDDEEEQPRNAKEAFAMNAMTVEDHEREKKRRKKIQQEADRLAREIRESGGSRQKKKPYEKEMAFTVAEEAGKEDSVQEEDEEEDGEVKPSEADDVTRWKRLALCLLVVLVVGIGAGVAYFVSQGANEATPATVETSDTEAPGISATPSPTASPVSSPTTISIYEPNSAEACANIANKESVPFQDQMILRSLYVQFDVSLTLQLSDVTEVVQEMERRMQLQLAPKLADCPDSGRFLREEIDRKLQINSMTNSVGNAQFFLTYKYNPSWPLYSSSIYGPGPDYESCEPSSSPEPCFRVGGRLDLYLKGNERTFNIILHVAENLPIEMDLRSLAAMAEAPFASILRVGTIDTQTSSPTYVETPRPTRYPTTRPTFVPTFRPTPPPTRPPTPAPTPLPTPGPTPLPTISPSVMPSQYPSVMPTPSPSVIPTSTP